MSVEQVSAGLQNYLKIIWALGEWSDAPISNSLIAQSAGVRLPTVSDALRKLSERGFIVHARYGEVRLTSEGERIAVQVIRRHRLLETFLHDELGFEWDEVHEEADNLEHVVSEKLIERIDRKLGSPSKDPHGDAIPTVDGRVSRLHAKQLSTVPGGRRYMIERISDSDGELLQFFASKRVFVDVEIEVFEAERFSETVPFVLVGSADVINLGMPAAAQVWVSELDGDAV